MMCKIFNQFLNTFIFSFLIILAACEDKYYSGNSSVNLNLSVGNKSELLKVLHHYHRNEEDSLKLKAALFLIANMNNHYSLDNQKINLCYSTLQSEVLNNEKENKADVSNARIPIPEKFIKKDLENIKADFLIKNIDDAFKAWQLPWSKKYDFNNFCEYILPYRIMHEPLRKNWRSKLFEEFKWVKDSLAEDSTNVKKATMLINDHIARQFVFLENNRFELPVADISTLFQYSFGICEHRYTMVVAALRAMGIAATIDETPLWHRYVGGHQWTVYFDHQGQSHPFNGGEIINPNDPLYFPDEHIIPSGSGNGTKIYRLNYSNNPKALANNISLENTIYPYFEDGKKEDVTHLYKMPITNINYSYNRSVLDTTNKIIYLCAFDYGREFKPIDWYIVPNDKGTVSYSHVGGGASTYVLAQYKNKKLIPVSNPFQFAEDTLMESFVPSQNRVEQIKLIRKFPATMKARDFAHNMEGAKFQGADNKQFINPTTLYTIVHEPDQYYFREVLLNSPKKFRYIRYLSDTASINVAEIQFYTKEDTQYKLLNGNTLKFINGKEIDSSFVYFSDNNIRTNFNAPAGSWIGFDLGKPFSIDKVKFLFRNNFNIVEQGDRYELFYFDYGWKSLGKQQAKDNYLIYKNVPDSALFTIKNYTRGREERIFFYRWEKQHWL